MRAPAHAGAAQATLASRPSAYAPAGQVASNARSASAPRRTPRSPAFADAVRLTGLPQGHRRGRHGLGRAVERWERRRLNDRPGGQGRHSELGEWCAGPRWGFGCPTAVDDGFAQIAAIPRLHGECARSTLPKSPTPRGWQASGTRS